jgi:hypothetical protein
MSWKNEMIGWTRCRRFRGSEPRFLEYLKNYKIAIPHWIPNAVIAPDETDFRGGFAIDRKAFPDPEEDCSIVSMIIWSGSAW